MFFLKKTPKNTSQKLGTAASGTYGSGTIQLRTSELLAKRKFCRHSRLAAVLQNFPRLKKGRIRYQPWSWDMNIHEHSATTSVTSVTFRSHFPRPAAFTWSIPGRTDTWLVTMVILSKDQVVGPRDPFHGRFFLWRLNKWGVILTTLPETNSKYPQKTDGWNTVLLSYWVKRPIFRGFCW